MDNHVHQTDTNNIEALTKALSAEQDAQWKRQCERMAHLRLLRYFIGHSQLSAMTEFARSGEEFAFYREKLYQVAEHLATMPKTYEQNGLGDDAIAHLHYFAGNGDWYITERDVGDAADADPLVQQQAYGLADLFGDGGEMGYISIQELIENGAELDLHFEPQPLKEIRAARERRASRGPGM